MRKIFFVISTSVFLITASLSACKNESRQNHPASESSNQHYQCPMKCSDEIYNKPGKCSVCEMELEKITKS
jgi:hypothetical protein